MTTSNKSITDLLLYGYPASTSIFLSRQETLVSYLCMDLTCCFLLPTSSSRSSLHSLASLRFWKTVFKYHSQLSPPISHSHLLLCRQIFQGLKTPIALYLSMNKKYGKAQDANLTCLFSWPLYTGLCKHMVRKVTSSFLFILFPLLAFIRQVCSVLWSEYGQAWYQSNLFGQRVHSLFPASAATAQFLHLII